MANPFVNIISNELFTLYNQGVNELIRSQEFTPVKLVFPSKKVECINCIYDTNSKRSSNIYKTGGPVSFNNGTICPYCRGAGLIENEVSENITAIIIWNKQTWLPTESKAMDWQTASGLVDLYTYIENLPKIQRANYIIINTVIAPYNIYKFKRVGDAQSIGLQQNKYIVQKLERFG